MSEKPWEQIVLLIEPIMKNEPMQELFGSFHYQIAALLLAFISFVVKHYYLTLGSDYHAYLVSDMLGYWERAHSVGFQYTDWICWPPADHELLRFVLWILKTGFPKKDPLYYVLDVGLLASSLSVYPAWLIARQITGNQQRALVCAGIYALLPVFFIDGCCLLSENVTVPLATFATWMILSPEQTKPRAVLTGLLIGALIVLRPQCVPLLAFFLAVRNRSLVKHYALFPALAVIAFSTIVIGFLSHGICLGLSQNAGMTFYMQQTAVQGIDTVYRHAYESYSFSIAPPGASGWLPIQHLHVALNDQSWFYRHALRKWSVIWDLWNLRLLLLSPAFPMFTTIFHADQLDAVSMLTVGFLTISSLRSRWRAYQVLILTIVAISFAFGSDRRFLYPYISLIIPLGIICAADSQRAIPNEGKTPESICPEPAKR